MMNYQTKPNVPLSRPLILGQPDSSPGKWDTEGGGNGTEDLKTLALKVLQRDKRRDNGSKITESNVSGERNRTEAQGISEGEAFPPDDKYARRVQETFRRMNRPDYPAGMIPWLEAKHPWIYRILVSYLPDTIHRQWEQSSPLHEFESTLAELLDVLDVALTLYRKEASQ
jgi:hypothetical protein